MHRTESSHAHLWAGGLSVLVIVATFLVVAVNPLGAALAYLSLLAGVIAVGLMTGGWGGLVASAIAVFTIVLFNDYAGVYARESAIVNIASELVAFLLVGPVAGNLAVAIQRMQRRADRWLVLAEERAVHDETFGTLKPKWAQVRLQEEALRAIACGRPLSVALLQLDPGPQAAVASRVERVAALQAMIRLARAIAPPPAVVAHAGGDQVLVILIEHTCEQATRLAEALRQQVAHTPYFPDLGEQSLGKPLDSWGQVSIGLSSLNGQATTGETLIAEAKANLSEAKSCSSLD